MTVNVVDPPKVRYGEIGNEFGEPINAKVYKAEEADAYIRHIKQTLWITRAMRAKAEKYANLDMIGNPTSEYYVWERIENKCRSKAHEYAGRTSNE